MNLKQTPKIAPDLIWRLLDDSVVVVSPTAGKVRVFNSIGTIIWQLLADQTSLAEIEHYLVTEYAITPEQAAGDLQAFLSMLTERGLVVWESKVV